MDLDDLDPQARATRGDHQSDRTYRTGEFLREIPSVSSLVGEARKQGSVVTDEALTRLVRHELGEIRRVLIRGEALDRGAIERRVLDAVGSLEQPRLVPVVNATGVVIHTNLGRAPVSAETAEAMRQAAAHAVPLEIEPVSNERGGRTREISGLLRALTGAEAALVVNNCASAVLLALSTVAKGREVVVSRGEAVEIGGGFRVPDVLQQSGAHLVEVGTTNRTYAHDYSIATSDQTAAYLKVHPSNFKSFGFVHSASTVELVSLAREHGLPVLEDLGSGALLDTSHFGLSPEPTLRGAIEAGVSLVMASGDKLLGGPQAGIVIGSREWIERVARHPLARAVRADKTTLAGTAANLRHYALGEAIAKIPVWRMIAASAETIQRRATLLAGELSGAGVMTGVEAVEATVGGGSLPGETLASWAVTLAPRTGENVDELARRLRLGSPAIFGRVDQDRVLLDLRTVLPEEEETMMKSLRKTLGA